MGRTACEWLGGSAIAFPAKNIMAYKCFGLIETDNLHQTSGRTCQTQKRSQTTSWRDFIAAHMNVLAGADFFTVEVLSWRGLVTYYVLFFIHLESRRVNVAGITQTSGSRVDGADRPQRHPGDLGLSSSMPLCSA